MQKRRQELRREAMAHYALQRYDAMLAVCEQALEEQHDTAHIYHAKAIALLGLGRYEEAITSLNRALELDTATPGYARAWITAEKARALCVLGRRAEALQAYEQASRLSPNDRTILAEKKHLEADLGLLDPWTHQEPDPQRGHKGLNGAKRT